MNILHTRCCAMRGLSEIGPVVCAHRKRWVKRMPSNSSIKVSTLETSSGGTCKTMVKYLLDNSTIEQNRMYRGVWLEGNPYRNDTNRDLHNSWKTGSRHHLRAWLGPRKHLWTSPRGNSRWRGKCWKIHSQTELSGQPCFEEANIPRSTSCSPVSEA